MKEPRELPVYRVTAQGTETREGTKTRDKEFFTTQLAYSKSGRSRFTQDSPILADVLVHYGLLRNKDKRIDLLVTPDWTSNPQELHGKIRDRLGDHDPQTGDAEHEKATDKSSEFMIAHNHSVVAVRLTFRELLTTLLPMSWWFQKRLVAAGLRRSAIEVLTDKKLRPIARDDLIAGLRHQNNAERDFGDEEDEFGDTKRPQRDLRLWIIDTDMIWAARLFYAVQYSNIKGRGHLSLDQPERIADYFFGLIDEIAARQSACRDQPAPKKLFVYSINRNRTINPAVWDSVETTKADAVWKTFDVKGEGICWAIIDTGIDARHGAFRKFRNGVPEADPFGPKDKNHTRIRRTYDFSDIRQKLSTQQRRGLHSGRMLDWASLEEELEVPHKPFEYRTPVQAHGTHVAGILAADWQPKAMLPADPLGPPPSRRSPTRPLSGLCPKIELYDLRVFNGAPGDEFAVISALQFVRSINERHDKREIHGVNMSLAMNHEVSNYACGRSPVCEECTRLVGSGVVVVAAAGNDGRSIHMTPQQQQQEGFRTVSIADPGNTEAVITVGSTHRSEPHTYGVSYFSSRGPTGDGRMKPDLVAPGEKITSTVPGDGMAREDGTSQAAPHVSAAAALLMCRHSELIGEPARVKKVLMDTATDLHRERHFQGAGLVDILRAIQSL